MRRKRRLEDIISMKVMEAIRKMLEEKSSIPEKNVDSNMDIELKKHSRSMDGLKKKEQEDFL